MGSRPQKVGYLIAERFKILDCRGADKYSAKRENTVDGVVNYHQMGIYSTNTLRSYRRICNNFESFCNEMDVKRVRDLEELKPLAAQFLGRDSTLSHYTLATERAALAKLLGVPGTEICSVEGRSRSEIKRSRIVSDTTKRGRFNADAHVDLVNFCLATGLRRSELTRVRGDQLVKFNGRWAIHVEGNQAKGGRERYAIIRGEHVEEVVSRMRSAGSERVWPRVPSNMDVHYYRGQYAEALYKELARPLDELKEMQRSGDEIYLDGEYVSAVYVRRGDDYGGEILDREAMHEVSESMGHSRVSVISENYLNGHM